MKHLYITLLLIGFFTLNTPAVSASVSFDPPAKLEVLNKDFPVFKDLDDQILYVDFELINTNLRSIKIVDQIDKVSFEEEVGSRSVDEIYEIDYSTLESGTYRIELNTYVGDVLTAHFEIK